jgi:hypothetical protein
LNLTRLRAIKRVRLLVSYRQEKAKKIIQARRRTRGNFRRQQIQDARSSARVITHGGHGQAVTRASKLANKKIMWHKIILAAIATAAAADGAAKPAFLQACEDDGDAGCAAKLATAAAGDDVATVEASA